MAFYFGPEGNLRLQEFDQWPWLVHGFSTRAAGDMAEPDRQQRFVQALAGGMKLVTVRQIHSGIVHLAGGVRSTVDSGRRGDSLITRSPGLLAGVKTADCFPVLIVDARRRAAAAIHAGWRGTAQRVVEKTAGEMRLCFHCLPSDLFAAIGPGIQACCFEVGVEVLEAFASQFTYAAQFSRPEPRNPALDMLPRQVMTGGQGLLRQLDAGRGQVDLAEACRRQLLAAGIPGRQIYNSGLCTACESKRFYSYRREKGAAGRMLAVIGVRRAGT